MSEQLHPPIPPNCKMFGLDEEGKMAFLIADKIDENNGRTTITWTLSSLTLSLCQKQIIAAVAIVEWQWEADKLWHENPCAFETYRIDPKSCLKEEIEVIRAHERCQLNVIYWKRWKEGNNG